MIASIFNQGAIIMTLREFGRALTRSISAVTKPIGDFLRKHWVSVVVVMLGLVVFGVITALLVFAWPAFIATAAAATVTLPLIGTVAPLAFLSSLSIPAASAVLGSFAFAGFVVASGILAGAIKTVVEIYNYIDNFFTGDLPNEGRQRAIDAATKASKMALSSAYDAGVRAGASPYHRRRQFENAGVFHGDYSQLNVQNEDPFKVVSEESDEDAELEVLHRQPSF